ncbi:MAG: hypothetical protein GF398_03145 [Chitinivibrionales bacterium]|nr:hypothetical protein [Chitinivibrionales bacterium]
MADYPKDCGASEDMKVDGKVGIGVSSPSAKLQISGTNDLIRTDYTGILNNPHFWLTSNAYYDGSWNRITSGRQCAGFVIGNTDGKFTFVADNNTTGTPSFSNLVRIEPTGEVGIGTTSPASRLEVDGGDIEVDDSSRGLILRSPDGKRWRVNVDNSGQLSTDAL